MKWVLVLDDERSLDQIPIPEELKKLTIVLAKSYYDAVDLCVYIDYSPEFISFDHDLGSEESGLDFAKWLRGFYDYLEAPPAYQVHSSNPDGAKNIIAFMESWKKSIL